MTVVNDAVTSSGAPDGIGVERALALHYAPSARREALRAVWRLDARMRRTFVDARDPMLAKIKLAWWEERLLALHDGHAPAEPLLRRLADLVVADHEVAADLGRIAGGWRELPEERPWPPASIDAYARSRGRGLINGFARVVGVAADERLRSAGEAYAIYDLAGLTIDPDERAALRERASERLASTSRLVWPRAMRPIGMILALAREDAGRDPKPRQGSPRRIARMAWHRLSGR